MLPVFIQQALTEQPLRTRDCARFGGRGHNSENTDVSALAPLTVHGTQKMNSNGSSAHTERPQSKTGQGEEIGQRRTQGELKGRVDVLHQVAKEGLTEEVAFGFLLLFLCF